MSISDRDLAAWRLRTQRLVGEPLAGPTEVVRHLLGVQAENYGPATWAVGARCAPTTSGTIDQLYSAGSILRTHVLRTTWHFVDPDDIGWLCALTGPRLRRLQGTLQRRLGIDDDTLRRGVTAVVEAIGGEGPLTRQQIRERVEAVGAPTAGPALTLVTGTAEAEGIICSGPMQDGEHTHELIDRRAPNARRLDRDDAVAELTWRYVGGHGPVTEADLAYWACLTLGDARAGIAANAERLSSFDHDGRRYWYAAATEPDGFGGAAGIAHDGAHLLQILDEIYRGYQDSRRVIDHDQLFGAGREPALGMALVGGQVAGPMTRTLAPDAVTFRVTPFRKLTDREIGWLRDAAERCGDFLERPAELRIAAVSSR